MYGCNELRPLIACLLRLRTGFEGRNELRPYSLWCMILRGEQEIALYH